MTDRLKAIEDRARGLGWHVTVIDIPALVEFYCRDFRFTFDKSDEGYIAAERLLSLYEDGPVVEIRRHHGDCDDECTFYICPWQKEVMRAESPNSDWLNEFDVPTGNCPGAGKYKLVLWEDE